MFPGDYFSAFYFTGTYWPKFGQDSVFNPAWARGANSTIGMTLDETN